MTTPNHIPGMKIGGKRKGKIQSKNKKDAKEWQKHLFIVKKLNRERKQKQNANKPYEF